jgi:bifunctional DNA-binding transcriptional regulator/antitoxin component of YhaV-PrlF toxin-antitoxin module
MEVEVRVELRRKNQMTLPEKIASSMGVGEGSRLVIRYDPATGEARLRPLRDSYAGALRGVYGERAEEVAAYLEEERGGWGEP